MSLHQPLQRLDFLYIRALNTIFLRATVRVELIINETMAAPPSGDITANGSDIGITLRVMGNPSVPEGRYFAALPVLLEIGNPIFPDDCNSDNLVEVEQLVRNHLQETAGIGNYSVTTKVMKGITNEGVVTNTISQDGDIDVD